MDSVERDSTRLWALVARRIWSQTKHRVFGGPIYRWRFAGRTPDRVLIAPPDLRVADPQLAVEFYHGRFPLAGHLVETGEESPFQLKVSNGRWLRSLHGFRWLRHMRAAGSEIAAANARSLVSDWITLHGSRIEGPAWEPATVAKRIIAWLQHSSVVLQGAEFAFYRAFLKSLAMQIRYLRAVVPDTPDGATRLRARAALAFSALSLPVPPSALRAATRNLAVELKRQILPDGGHVSRDPLVVLEMLADLLPLRQTYANQAEAPPQELINAVDRMLPALRFFRLGDGAMARFNGMGATIQDRILTILRHDDTVGAPLLHASHSGYERLALGRTVVIADTGAAPPFEMSQRAHAGCLAFEMSSGRNPLIVNSGVDSYASEDFRPLARATAAHSTATINDTSSARFALQPGMARWLGTPLVDGPKEVRSTRLDKPGQQGFVASHDGYLPRFGIIHERGLRLSDDGAVLTGMDRFFGSGGQKVHREQDAVSIRFHLHPDIELFRDDDERLVLVTPQHERWTLSSPDVVPTVEESIFFASLGGPLRSRQIVLAFRASELGEVRWRFSREGN
ncbi:MAG: heparinase II/III family protein [Rhizobiaceae bacterium]|nr:heparinase II/III family protein [Rhizobiaceae bacterium]